MKYTISETFFKKNIEWNQQQTGDRNKRGKSWEIEKDKAIEIKQPEEQEKIIKVPKDLQNYKKVVVKRILLTLIC